MIALYAHTQTHFVARKAIYLSKVGNFEWKLKLEIPWQRTVINLCACGTCAACGRRNCGYRAGKLMNYAKQGAE